MQRPLMKMPPLQHIHNFASDVACRRAEIREFMAVSGWLLAIPLTEKKRLINWLNDAHPEFRTEAEQLLPRLYA